MYHRGWDKKGTAVISILASLQDNEPVPLSSKTDEPSPCLDGLFLSHASCYYSNTNKKKLINKEQAKGE